MKERLAKNWNIERNRERLLHWLLHKVTCECLLFGWKRVGLGCASSRCCSLTGQYILSQRIHQELPITPERSLHLLVVAILEARGAWILAKLQHWLVASAGHGVWYSHHNILCRSCSFSWKTKMPFFFLAVFGWMISVPGFSMHLQKISSVLILTDSL